MAVAVRETMEAATQKPVNRLAIGSLAGTLYVLGSLAIIFYAVPRLWDLLISPLITSKPGSAVDASLMMVVMFAAAVGLVYLGQRLVGPNPPHGQRAGIFAGVVGVLFVGWLVRVLGGALEASLGTGSAALGLGIMGLAAVVLLGLLASLFFRPAFDARLVHLEDQGWFTATSYKKNQGQRVRRGTIIGILILFGCGIYTLLSHETLGQAASPNWEVRIPFTEGRHLTLLPDVQFTVPILLTALALWLAYRLVNFPVFADFLIATEAELNKVSWTTRKRLVQDTIVVLTTVILFTLFLLFVDVLWVKILSSRWISVLRAGDTTTEKQTGPLDW